MQLVRCRGMASKRPAPESPRHNSATPCFPPPKVSGPILSTLLLIAALSSCFTKGDKTARDVFGVLYKFRTGGETGENSAATIDIDPKVVRGGYGRRCAIHYASLLGLKAEELVSGDLDKTVRLERTEGLTGEPLEDKFHEVMSMPKRRR